MRRIPLFAALAAGAFLCATVWAQEVIFRGFVQKVDPVDFTITLRTSGNPRIVPVTPSATVTIGGKAARLEEIPLNSSVHIVAVRDSQGIPRATRIDVEFATPLPSATTPPGSVVRGTVVGIDLATNSISVRTNAGDLRVELASAPVFLSGRQVGLRALRVGDVVEVQREIPTPGGSEYLTKVITITGRSGAGGASQVGETTSTAQTRSSRVYSSGVTTRRAGTRGAHVIRRTSSRSVSAARAGSRHRSRTSRIASYRGRYRGHRAGYRYSSRSRRGSGAHRTYRASRHGAYRTTRVRRYGTTGATSGTVGYRSTSVRTTVPGYRPVTPAQNPAGYQTNMWRSRPR